jgi:hypothetical protein
MKVRTRLARLILSGALLLSSLALAQNTSTDVDKAVDSNVGDHVQVHHFVTNLQQAVAKHDAATVASLVHYPIAVKLNGKIIILRTPQSFIANYDRILTPEIAAVVEKQKYEDLFVNYQGAMFGNGQVWIAGICRDKACKQSDIKIRTIQSTADLK